MNSTIELIFEGLLTPYKERVPDVNKITNSLIDAGIITQVSDIENDHIAFRTMGVPNLGIKSLERIFLHHGYKRKDAYFFEGKKLDAFWYAPPVDELPRIFISELRVKDLSPKVQKIIHSYTNEVKTDPTIKLDLDNAQEVNTFLHSSLWRLPTFKDYEQLKNESEYASWVIYNRYYLNHYTISVHNLSTKNTLAEFNDFLENIGIKLNDAGGKIKQSPDGLLLQSSTISKMVDATFAEGVTKSISGSYVEFAERRVLPQFAHLAKEKIRRAHRRDGFESQNADKIFESTYISQTNK